MHVYHAGSTVLYTLLMSNSKSGISYENRAVELCHLSIDRIDAVTSEDSEFPHNFGQTSNQKLPNNPNNYRFYLGLTFFIVISGRP